MADEAQAIGILSTRLKLLMPVERRAAFPK
jgi:hypothetical protein